MVKFSSKFGVSALFSAAALMGASEFTSAETQYTIASYNYISNTSTNVFGGDAGLDSGGDVTSGYTFTITEADIYITELASHSTNLGTNQTLSLYNADTGELLASLDNTSASTDWEFHALDAPIATEAGGNYAVLVNTSAGAELSRLAMDDAISYVDNYAFTDDKPIEYTDVIHSIDSGATFGDGSFFSTAELAVVDTSLGLGWVSDGFYGLVDVGFDTEANLASQGVLVPTPSAAAIGMLSLGLLYVRRRRS